MYYIYPVVVGVQPPSTTKNLVRTCFAHFYGLVIINGVSVRQICDRFLFEAFRSSLRCPWPSDIRVIEPNFTEE